MQLSILDNVCRAVALGDPFDDMCTMVMVNQVLEAERIDKSTHRASAVV